MKIVNTDAMSFLKTQESNSVDLIVTDPPYAISRDTNFASGEATGADTDRFRVSMDFGSWDVVDSEYFKAMFKEYYRTLKKGGVAVVFYDLWKIQELREWMEAAGFRMFRFCKWEKTNPVPINRKKFPLSNSWEAFIVCVKGSSPVYNMYWLDDTGKYSDQDKGIFSYPICHEEGRFHPTQKPLPLIKDLISIFSNEGDTVMDTFLGSGTTAAAALELNRTPVGCELSGEYYSKLMERLNV